MPALKQHAVSSESSRLKIKKHCSQGTMAALVINGGG